MIADFDVKPAAQMVNARGARSFVSPTVALQHSSAVPGRCAPCADQLHILHPRSDDLMMPCLCK